MQTAVIKRLAEMGVALLSLSFAIFSVVRLVPGDPFQILFSGAAPGAGDAGFLQSLHNAAGLDRPLLVQYAGYLGQLLHGNLGVSLRSGEPVILLIGRHLAPTLELAGAALILSLGMGIFFGLALSLGRKRWWGELAGAAVSFAVALPSAGAGILLIYIFGLQLGWLPTFGWVAQGWSWPEAPRHLILPALTLSIHPGAVLARLIESNLATVLEEDYVRTAYAKGVGLVRVLTRHALKNTALPVVTFAALEFGTFAGGAVVVETVFSWPGLGRLLVDAVANRDYALIQGATLFAGAAFLAINFCADLMYLALDPRLRYE